MMHGMPETREIETLYPKVLQYAPGCPEPTAIEHLRDAAVQLCKSTRCWRDIDEFETEGLGPEEIPGIQPYAALFEIEKAWYNDHELERKGFGHDMLFHDAGEPRYITQVGPNSVMLDPAGAGTLKISMFLMPSENAETLPLFFFDQFPRALADGALGTLLLLPNQPFTNPQLGVVFANKFQAVLDRNFAFNMRGQQRARKRTKPNYF